MQPGRYFNDIYRRFCFGDAAFSGRLNPKQFEIAFKVMRCARNRPPSSSLTIAFCQELLTAGRSVSEVPCQPRFHNRYSVTESIRYSPKSTTTAAVSYRSKKYVVICCSISRQSCMLLQFQQLTLTYLLTFMCSSATHFLFDPLALQVFKRCPTRYVA